MRSRGCIQMVAALFLFNLDPVQPEQCMWGVLKHGLTDHICFWAPSKDSDDVYLLDGRNRLEAMERVSVDIPFADGLKGLIKRIFFGNDNKYSDPYAVVISANIHRRHFTGEQKRELIGKLLKATPEKSNRQIAEMTKTSHPTVAKERAKLEATGDVEKVTTSIRPRALRRPATFRPSTKAPLLEPPCGMRPFHPTSANRGIRSSASRLLSAPQSAEPV